MKKKNTLATEPEVAQKEIIAVPKKFIWFGYAALFVLAFLLYANTLTHDYVLDDAAAITKNKIVQQGVNGIPELLKTGFYYGYFGYNNNLYRPLPLITFAIGHSLWGNNVHAEHFINVLLYSLMALLLFYTLLQFFGKQRRLAALGIAALFIAHPIHTEVVANIKSRDEILAFIFCCLSMNLMLKYANGKKLIWLLAGGVSLFFGILSKESAIAFLLIIPLSIYFFIPTPVENEKKNIISKTWVMPLLVSTIAVAVYFVIRFALFHNDPETVIQVMPIDNVMSGESFFNRLPTAMMVLGRYLFLLVLPHPLVCDYSFKSLSLASFTDLQVILSFLILIVLLAFALIGFRRKSDLSFSILFFFISIFIVSNIAVTIGAGMAERFLFTPSLGFCIALGILLFKLTGSSENNWKEVHFRRWVMPLGALLLLLYGFKTTTRNASWKNQLTLFSDDVKNAPLSARLHFSLGTQLIEESKTEKNLTKQKEIYLRAENELKRTLSIYPKYAEAIISLGNLYQEQGDYIKADEYLNQVSSSGIGQSSASKEQLIYNKANALLGMKDYQGALNFYRQALALNPNMTESYINMGVTYKEMNLFDSAIIALKSAIRIDPKSSEAYLNIGTCYSALNDFKNAISNFNKAIELNPSFAEAYIDLGDIYNRTHQLDEAEKAFQKAIELNPRIPEAQFNLGYCYILKADYNHAMSYLMKAYELRPAYPDALINISFCASKLGRYQEVIDYAQKAILLRPDIPDLYYNIAYGYAQLGDKNKAMEYRMLGDKVKAGKK